MLRLSEQVTIRGGSQLHGLIRAVPSKSHAHRVVLAASLSSESSRIENPSLSEDIRATIEAVEAYGTQVKFKGGSLVITGADRINAPTDIVSCGESGSTIRFVTPILSHAEGISVITGGPSLRKRPMQPMIASLRQLGVQCYSVRNDGCAPLVLLGGTYKGGKVNVVGDVSSQFISGLLFSAPLATQSTSIVVTTPLESAPYVQMTTRILKCHGIEVNADASQRKFDVPGGQSACSYDHVIEGDYSSAAFPLAAGAVTGSEIGVSGLQISGSIQGDSKILSLLKEMGVDLQVEDGSVFVRSSHLRATEIEAKDCPDLVPPLAAVACYAEGTTRIVKAERLRIKESNRLAALSGELEKMGARIRETEDGLEITGVTSLRGAKVSSHGDHRIAMACAVAALAAEGETVIDGAMCVAKSYPVFFDDLRSLGGDIVGRE